MTIFDIITRAKNLCARVAGRTVSERTLAEYRRVFVRLWKSNLDPFRAGISRDYYGKRRAALTFVAAFWLESLCRRCLAAIERKDAAAVRRWGRVMLRVCRRVEPMFELEPPSPSGVSPFEIGTSRWRALNPAPVRRGQNSKRRLLGRLPRDWQDKIWSEAQAGFAFLDALALLIATPCRTAELTPGPRAEFWSPGALLQIGASGHLLITIAPAKTRRGRFGPSLITLEYDVGAAGPSVRHLHAVCADAGGEYVIAVQNTDAFRKQIEGLGRAVFPEVDEAITPLTYRHQFIADAKKSFGAGVLVAALAGQSTDRTQARYGRHRHGRTRKGLVAVWTPKLPRSGNVARAHRLGRCESRLARYFGTNPKPAGEPS